MRIGVFFGSFNPTHNGHIAIAEHFLKEPELEEVWLSISPQNPWKEAQGLAAFEHRIKMAQLAVENNPHIRVSDFEKELPQPSYTYEALVELKQKFPQHSFTLLIGGDNYSLFHKWRNYDKILEKFEVWAYPRKGDASSPNSLSKIKLFKAPLFVVSSTDIREQLKGNKTCNGISPKVLDYIKTHQLYKPQEE